MSHQEEGDVVHDNILGGHRGKRFHSAGLLPLLSPVRTDTVWSLDTLLCCQHSRSYHWEIQYMGRRVGPAKHLNPICGVGVDEETVFGSRRGANRLLREDISLFTSLQLLLALLIVAKDHFPVARLVFEKGVVISE